MTRQQKGTPIDATYGRFALGAFFLGICCAGGYYAITSNLYGALTVFSAVEALAAGVVAPVICEMSLHGSKALLEEYGVSIPDWESVMDAADVNAAMMHATDLFPEGAVEQAGGQAMAAAAAWDGKITIEETVALFSIGGGLTAKSFTDAIAVETMELVQRNYSDTISGRTAVGAFCRPVTLS